MLLRQGGNLGANANVLMLEDTSFRGFKHEGDGGDEWKLVLDHGERLCIVMTTT